MLSNIFNGCENNNRNRCNDNDCELNYLFMLMMNFKMKEIGERCIRYKNEPIHQNTGRLEIRSTK